MVKGNYFYISLQLDTASMTKNFKILKSSCILPKTRAKIFGKGREQ